MVIGFSVVFGFVIIGVKHLLLADPKSRSNSSKFPLVFCYNTQQLSIDSVHTPVSNSVHAGLQITA